MIQVDAIIISNIFYKSDILFCCCITIYWNRTNNWT